MFHFNKQWSLTLNWAWRKRSTKTKIRTISLWLISQDMSGPTKLIDVLMFMEFSLSFTYAETVWMEPWCVSPPPYGSSGGWEYSNRKTSGLRVPEVVSVKFQVWLDSDTKCETCILDIWIDEPQEKIIPGCFKPAIYIINKLVLLRKQQ